MTAAPAAPELPADVARLFDETLRGQLVALRRAIHADPELSFQEERTAQKLERALSEIGARDVRRVAKTGVVARVPGRDRKAPIVAVRGDIDALPVREETGLPFASHNEGVMHACGHDVHATWAVAAAALLARAPAAGDATTGVEIVDGIPMDGIGVTLQRRRGEGDARTRHDPGDRT